MVTCHTHLFNSEVLTPHKEKVEEEGKSPENLEEVSTSELNRWVWHVTMATDGVVCYHGNRWVWYVSFVPRPHASQSEIWSDE